VSDTIVDMSKLAGAPLEQQSPQIPDDLEVDESELRYGLEELLTPNGPARHSVTSGPEAREEEKYEAHARVFIIGTEGNEEYEGLLVQGANGDVILARREINDLQGTTQFKVYMEWMVPIKKKAKLKERHGP